MKTSYIRPIIEISSVVIILALAGLSFMPSFQGNEHLELDHSRLAYTGHVAKHKFNGQGKLTLPNHDVYSGQFKDGRFNGRGKFISHTGWTFKGNFVQGVPTGQEQIYNGKTLISKGILKDGKLINAN